MVLPFYIHPSNRLTSTFFEYPASSLNIPKILREKTVPSRATTILTCVSIRATSTRSQAPVMSELWYWNICHVNCQVCCAFIQKLPCTDPRSCSNPSRTVACFHCWFVNKPLLAETIRREIPWHCKRDEGSHAENLCGKADTSLRMFHRPFSVQIQASQHQTWTVDAGTVRGQSGVGERYPKEVRLPGNTGGVFLEFKSIIVRLALPPPNWVVKC
jgi:hypothetical protein